MKILLSNDDGYQAMGIVALYEALKATEGVQVEVVAPEHNNSAKSNSLTLHSPLYVYEAANGFRYVNGTPADCVHIALTGLLGYRPDLVVSGINNGANMGDDTIYSGTVGAAMEGYLFGIPAIAFSQIEKGWAHLDAAAARAAQLVQQLGRHQVEGGKPWLLNVNIPNLPLDELKPVKVCRLGRRHAAERVITQTNPRGDTMYWIGGAGPAADAAEGTDFHATAQGHLSLTPLKVDLTDRDALSYWAQGVARLTQGEGRLMATQRPGFPARIFPAGNAPAAPARRPAAPVPPAAPAPTGAARDPIPARGRMVQQLAADGIQDAAVLRAMGAVERHRFVDGALVPQAYEDTALPIGLGQTISKPSVVARMVELLMQGGLRGEDGRLGRVLDIGTGCGYQAVVLGQLATEVYSIERLRDLHEKARANLRPLRIANVHLILGDGMAGFAKGAPYAGIIAAAGGELVPDAWIDQLAVGGRIVAPLASSGGQALVVVDKSRQGVSHTVLEAVNFVPLKSGVA